MKTFLTIVCLLFLAGHAVAEEQLTIAAAADLQFVMPEIANRFEKETGTKVKLSFGSSGNFFAQIQNGAPFDLFFSADIDYPKRLEAAGSALSGSLYQYAIGKIVLWAPKNSAIDVNHGLSVLAAASVKTVAIANPAHAPYGRAAEAALRNARLWDKVASKLVMGENISQTAEFVQSGSADAGILALSLVLAPSMKDQGKYFVIPQSLYPPIVQAGIVIRNSQHQQMAVRFMEFLKRDEIKSELKQFGFSLQ